LFHGFGDKTVQGAAFILGVGHDEGNQHAFAILDAAKGMVQRKNSQFGQVMRILLKVTHRHHRAPPTIPGRQAAGDDVMVPA
jgi:hypothetical protein